MTHPRQTIREQATTLVTGLSTTGTNVFASRVYPVESASLPALCVYTGSESALQDEDTMGNDKLVEVELNIEARAAKSSDLDDQLDDIVEEVQAAFAGDRKLSGALARKINYIGIQGPEWSTEGDRQHAIMTIQYAATYEVTL